MLYFLFTDVSTNINVFVIYTILLRKLLNFQWFLLPLVDTIFQYVQHKSVFDPFQQNSSSLLPKLISTISITQISLATFYPKLLNIKQQQLYDSDSLIMARESDLWLLVGFAL